MSVTVENTVQRLVDALRVQTKSGKDGLMARYVWDQVMQAAPHAVVTSDQGNIYVDKGGGPRACIVAHLDTVHDLLKPGEFDVYIDRGHLFGWNDRLHQWEGVGGDDKVGIWVALEALRCFKHIKLAFFRDEEWGCQGSAKADLTFFEDVTLVLQADRRGTKDFVRRAAGTWLHGDEFADAVDPIIAMHGYEAIEHGGMTDVMKLREIGLSVASANMSAGYFEEHTHREYVDIAAAEVARDLIFAITDKLGGQRWEWLKPKPAPALQWPTIPSRYRDPRYVTAVVNSVCPVCHANKNLVWDAASHDWWCGECGLSLFGALAELGPPKRMNTAWSDAARTALWDCYEAVALQTGDCVACGQPDTLDWSDADDRIFCTACMRSLDAIVRHCIRELTFDPPKGD